MHPPIPLRLYAAIWLATVAVGAVVHRTWEHPVVLVVYAVLGTILVFLLRGSRVVWSLLVISDAAALVTGPFGAMPALAIASAAAGLACLLWPTTRRYVWRRAAA
jgi:hypothetical protein